MNVLKETTANQIKINQAHSSWQHLLDEVLRSRFYGTAAIELTISDGTITRICRRLQQIEK